MSVPIVAVRRLVVPSIVACACLLLGASGAFAQNVGDPMDLGFAGNGHTVLILPTGCDPWAAQATGGITAVVRGAPTGPWLGTIKRLVVVTETIPQCPIIVVTAPPPGTYWVALVYGLVNGDAGPGAIFRKVVVAPDNCTRPPDPPRTSLDHPLIDGHHVSLNFDAAPGCVATSLEIAVSTHPLSPPTTWSPVPTAGYQTAAPSGSFYVRVRSRNAHGPSKPSTVYPIKLPGGCAELPNNGLPQGPINPVASVSNSRVTLSWSQPMAGTTFYVLSVNDLTTGWPRDHIVIGPTTSFTSPPLGPGNYRVGVAGGNECGTTEPITGDVFFTVP
jgi:hypothetical protein